MILLFQIYFLKAVWQLHLDRICAEYKLLIGPVIFFAVLFVMLKTITWLTHTHTHTHLTALCPGLPGWAGTRKVKPIWILMKQEIGSGSGISWAICKSALSSRQITTPAPHHSVFYRPDALPAAQPTASKHWRQTWQTLWWIIDSQVN